MRLSSLLREVNSESVYSDCEISLVTDKFEKIMDGCAFVCINGNNFDAHMVAIDAEEKGASVIIAEHDTGAKNQVIVNSTREAYALMCSAFYGNPGNDLKVIGITGTNGKTSTAFLLREILEHAGHKCGMLGTVLNYTGKRVYSSKLTTPDPSEIFKLLREMVDNGCEFCVMEASSQALDQHRISGIRFNTAVFSNLTTDHLDYHGTIDNYKRAKKILFENSDKAIINIDDENAEYMVDGLDINTVKYSAVSDNANYTAKNIKYSESGVLYELVGECVIGRIRLNIPGKFTVYNSMAAAVTALESGVRLSDVIDALSETNGIAGRMENVPIDKDYSIIIDYAHTPDGLENLLSSVKQFCKGRIITVFGCGGDRDKTKRPIMGEIAGNMSDIAVVTSDNPRSENPEKIIEDILEGMKSVKSKIKVVSDRTEAIKKAISLAKENDVIVLAGKGHETYQILDSGKIHYDEREIIKEILKEQSGE